MSMMILRLKRKYLKRQHYNGEKDPVTGVAGGAQVGGDTEAQIKYTADLIIVGADSAFTNTPDQGPFQNRQAKSPVVHQTGA